GGGNRLRPAPGRWDRCPSGSSGGWWESWPCTEDSGNGKARILGADGGPPPSWRQRSPTHRQSLSYSDEISGGSHAKTLSLKKSYGHDSENLIRIANQALRIHPPRFLTSMIVPSTE